MIKRMIKNEKNFCEVIIMNDVNIIYQWITKFNVN